MELEQYRTVMLENAVQVLRCDSPSGFTRQALELTKNMAEDLGYRTKVSRRGCLAIEVPGREEGKTVACYAHMDTLGLVVRSIDEKGRLLLSPVGLPVLPTLDGEYCRIYTRGGEAYTGTILSLSPAYHVEDDSSTRPRDEHNMYIRLDMPVYSRADVTALGLRCGDTVCIDPKTQVTPSGFIKSRFLDDKASVAVLLTLLRAMKEHGTKPKYRTWFIFTVWEEVGTGGAWQPEDLDEFLIVDMGCVGDELACTEQQVSICAKDTEGPYDWDMTTRLVNLAEANGIDYAVDVYPHYSSDAEVAWRSGCDAPAALIGTGVHASHGMERTHADGMMNTMKLCALYLDLA